MRKPAKQKFYIDDNAIKSYIDMIRAAKLPHKIIYSNYTTEIICEKLNFDFMFLNSFQSKKMFVAFNMIKGDFNNYTVNEIPTYTYNDVLFFEHAINREMQLKDVVNLDLNSAYATVLLNDGFIQQKTFDFLQEIPKIDRLACIGMFASRKTLFQYDEKGEVDKHELIKAKNKHGDETEGYFIYCIKKVGELMVNIRSKIGDDFLMFWVDGIYIKNNKESIQAAEQIIKDSNFKYKKKILPIFNTKIKNNKKISVELWEQNPLYCEKKQFNYSKPLTEFQKIVIDYINKLNK